MENSNDYYSVTKDKLFTDLALTLYDDTNEITINLHKIILYIRCIFFKKLLTSCCEKILNEIKIWVPNVYVARDIIISFYDNNSNKNLKMNTSGFSNWKYVLESAKCYDYFGLVFDKSLLENLKVPKEGFELLLEVIDIIDHDDKLIYLIETNLPTGYVLSDELRRKIMDRKLKHITNIRNLKLNLFMNTRITEDSLDFNFF